MKQHNEGLMGNQEQKNLQLLIQSAAVENAANSIVITDFEGTILWVNPAFTSLTGYTLQEAAGQTPRLLKSGRHNEQFYQGLWRTIRSGKTWRGEFTNRRKDGTLYEGEQTITPVSAEPGKMTHFVGIMNDVTQRKQAEKELRETHQKLRHLLAYSPAIIYSLYNDEGRPRLSSISDNVEKITGHSAQEAMQPGWWARHLHPEDAVRVKEKQLECFSQDYSTDEYRFQRKDGEYLWMRAQRSLVQAPAGQPSEIIGAWTDITEKKRLEAQLLRNDRMESIGTLAGGIAHDLNNALAPILMSVQLLKMKFTDAESVTILDTVESSARRGADMVRQVLTFSRGLEGSPTEIQLKHLVKEMQNIIQQTFPKTIHLQTELGKDIWTVIGDATQLHQVLLNLCVNARDAMPNGGKLSIKAENVLLDEHFAGMNPEAKAGAYILLSVADSGTGMPAGVKDRIFDPFFTTKPLGQGTGLGLPTVRGIVKSHGGFMSVYSEVGKGSEFRVYLPAKAGPSSKPEAARLSRLPNGQGELILVVDDEASIRNIAQQTLEMFGYRVLTASDGAQAVAACAEQRGKIRLMLTDLAMPIMDGPSTIRAVRSLDAGIKIIMASGLSTEGQSNETDLFHANAILHKPFTGEQLLKLVREVLDSGRKRP